MNGTYLRTLLNRRIVRNQIIKKLNNGLNSKQSTDKEVDEFTKGFLENWDNLRYWVGAQADFFGLKTEQERKEKEEQLKQRLSYWLYEDDALMRGYEYGWEKKEQIKYKIKNTGGSIRNKMRAGINVLSPGKKVGRNDACPCGSGKKYKKCCIYK